MNTNTNSSETSRTLAEALPQEIRRVRDEVMPEYEAAGAPGIFAVTMMKIELKNAENAILNQDVVAMAVSYKELKGFEL